MTLDDANKTLKQISKGMKNIPFISYAAVVENPNDLNNNNYFIEFGIRENIYKYLNVANYELNNTDKNNYNQNYFMGILKKEISVNKNADLYPNEIKNLIQNDTTHFGFESSEIELLNHKSSTITNNQISNTIINGISIGNTKMAYSGGTLGALIRLYDNNIYAITNSHVVADSDAESMEPISHPASIHISKNKTPVKEIGNLSFWVHNKKMDMALIKINKKTLPFLPNKNQKNSSSIQGISQCNVGDKIHKNGYKTKYSEGIVRSLNASININRSYNGKTENIVMTKQIMVEELIADNGDSGSLILNKKKHAVGLLFARDKKLGRAFFSPISSILTTEKKELGSPSLPFRIKEFL